MRVMNSDLVISDCVFSNNIATGGANVYRKGGGLYVQSGDVVVRRTRFEGNSSRVTSADWTGWSRGGAFYLEAGTLLVEHSWILNNISSGLNNQGSFAAGVSHAAGSQLTLRNCLIAGNENLPVDSRSHEGAGVEIFNGGRIENCTITGNRMHNASDNGAGLRVNGGSVTNTIVYGNLRGSDPNDFGGNTALVGFSCAPELTAGVNGNITGDPQFADASAGNFLIRVSSPAVNRGTNLAWMVEGVTDLSGNPRVAFGKVDMGAYENQLSVGSIFRLR